MSSVIWRMKCLKKCSEVKVVYFLVEVMTLLANQGIKIDKVNCLGIVKASTIPRRSISLYLP